MKYLQQQNGLSDTGVVDDATWAVLLGGVELRGRRRPRHRRPRPRCACGPSTSRPQYQLQIHWDPITLQDLNLAARATSTCHSTPNAQLHFLQPVGKLFGAGGIEVLHREVQSWPNWFVDWSTRATVDWAKGKGLQLGLQNDAETRLAPAARRHASRPTATSTSHGNR